MLSLYSPKTKRGISAVLIAFFGTVSPFFYSLNFYLFLHEIPSFSEKDEHFHFVVVFGGKGQKFIFVGVVRTKVGPKSKRIVNFVHCKA